MEDLDTPPVVIAPPDVLWNQADNISSSDIASQDFIDGGGSFDQYDSRAADDFLVPEGFLWIINTVRVFGAYDITPDPIQSLNIVFFRDNDGLPGNPVPWCVYKDILPEDILDPNFVTELPSPCRLRPGKYWVSVQANMVFLPNGQWFWFESTVQTLSPFVWENPGAAIPDV